MSCVVYYKISVAIKSNEALKSMQRQVNIFMLVWLFFLVVRYVGFVFLQAQWMMRNVVNNSTDVRKLDKTQEISCNICTIQELVSDIFLMCYLFLGRDNSKKKKKSKAKQLKQAEKQRRVSSSDACLGTSPMNSAKMSNSDESGDL